ncbi:MULTISPECIES: DUF881 domain-containing protein [Bacillus]|uniref:DUF881 domain-containing protein n=2 Tax=Bacillus TaxID=1386 RepID=A0A0M4G7F0_9BACI|nr:MULTISPECIES: DUF881 domain-containing protein [Bacillus]ALC80970.1 hypothetical protein AM592_04730 [Bacillus gobiensis]MBP1079921.1 uncharacterized protein YlxW (UPF0749 family) [Bacillus capparidis]MED1095308.1 DUF881 domain-containing protein [Bacillus capparidis]
MKGKTVILSLAMLILGIMISYSYQFAREKNKQAETSELWREEYSLRNELISQEKQNKELEKELNEKKSKVQAAEEKLKSEKKVYYNLLEDVEKYRMYVGEIGVKGKGVQVTLEDASYIPEGENVNNYIVHESHLFHVINEMLISGAEAIAINGQRITHQSYIRCNGPVVTVDGHQHPAPFTITAIGDPDVLIPALNISGGVLDQLNQDHVTFNLEEKDNIKIEPLLENAE